MIAIAATMVLMAASMQAAAAAPRQQFVACLKQTVEKANAGKMKPENFGAFARQSCAAQIGSFKQGLVSFDVKNGVGRKRAEADAELQIEDYLVGASEKIHPDS
jgi:hypothetical protein